MQQVISSIKSRKLTNDIIEKLKKSEEEIERGEGIEAKTFFKELRQKYGY